MADGDPRLAGLETSWTLRRRVVFATLAFCALAVAWLLFRGDPDSRLHETIASGLIFLAGSVVMAYVAGAAYDDRSRRQSWVAYQSRPLRGSARVDDPDG